LSRGQNQREETIKRRLEFALILLLLNRHPEDVCCALQKGDIVLNLTATTL
jgi:hypothetical protein